MVKYYKYIIAAVSLLLIGYIVGCTHPLGLLHFEYDSTQINRAEHIKIWISIVAAGLTFCAVTVALFKEKILAIFSKPKIDVVKPVNKPNIELVTDRKFISKNETIEAIGYVSRLLIRNTGNTAAMDVVLSLEKLEFKEHNYTITSPMEPPGELLKWNNKQDKISILPNSEKLINIIEIFPPKKTSTPEGKTEVQQDAELIIGNFHDCNKKTKAGVWTATFVLHAQNHKHISFTINIEWQGKWSGRLVDFENGYIYNIIDKK